MQRTAVYPSTPRIWIAKVVTIGAVFSAAIAFNIVVLAQPGKSPPWDPASFKNGSKVTSRNNDVEATLVLAGPPLWSYRVTGLKCPNCTGGVPDQIVLKSVKIVSNDVPDPCGNMSGGAFQPVQTHTAGWDPNPAGDMLKTNLNDSRQMTFKIECEQAKNGPIYLLVDFENESTKAKGNASVGPIPGPVSAE